MSEFDDKNHRFIVKNAITEEIYYDGNYDGTLWKPNDSRKCILSWLSATRNVSVIKIEMDRDTFGTVETITVV